MLHTAVLSSGPIHSQRNGTSYSLQDCYIPVYRKKQLLAGSSYQVCHCAKSDWILREADECSQQTESRQIFGPVDESRILFAWDPYYPREFGLKCFERGCYAPLEEKLLDRQKPHSHKPKRTNQGQ